MENFSALNLNDSLLRAIDDLGYTKPSPIQAETLPILLAEDTDFIGLAATGTGKTAAFSIPMLEKIDPNLKRVQAIILCPTRELVSQVAGQVNKLGRHMGVQAVSIYGGADYVEQINGLKRGLQVVVGTPGRTIDHINRGTLKLDNVKIVILDEADEMISMGFREDMETILASVPDDNSNIWLFSATMSSSVRHVADEFLESPKRVQVNREEMLSSTVEQYCYFTQEKNKPEVLCKLIDAADEFYGLVFCQTKALVVDLTNYLQERGYKVDCLHGDKTQAARDATMRAFRARRVSILIGTDVAARGLDVKDVTHVVNYSLPRELDNYVHRIGRTARSGKKGLAFSLVTPSHRYLLNRIEKLTGSRFMEGVIPTRRDLGAKKVASVLARFQDQPHFERAIELMDPAWREAIAEMSPEEIAGRFLALSFPEVFASAPPQTMERSERPERTDRPERSERPARPYARRDRDERPARFDRDDRDERPSMERPTFYPKKKASAPAIEDAFANAKAEDVVFAAGEENDNVIDTVETAVETARPKKVSKFKKEFKTEVGMKRDFAKRDFKPKFKKDGSERKSKFFGKDKYNKKRESFEASDRGAAIARKEARTSYGDAEGRTKAEGGYKKPWKKTVGGKKPFGKKFGGPGAPGGFKRFGGPKRGEGGAMPPRRRDKHV